MSYELISSVHILFLGEGLDKEHVRFSRTWKAPFLPRVGEVYCTVDGPKMENLRHFRVQRIEWMDGSVANENSLAGQVRHELEIHLAEISPPSPRRTR